MLFLFFFQAEDGIRDGHVTGVQTCALPISLLQNPTTSLSIVKLLYFPTLSICLSAFLRETQQLRNSTTLLKGWLRKMGMSYFVKQVVLPIELLVSNSILPPASIQLFTFK